MTSNMRTMKVIADDDIPDGWMGLDIGPKTQDLFAEAIKRCRYRCLERTDGRQRVEPALLAGTIAVAKAIADSGAISIIGGGDSAAAVVKLGFADKMTHISTGGGASLEFLEGHGAARHRLPYGQIIGAFALRRGRRGMLPSRGCF